MVGTPKTAHIGPPRGLKKKCLETWNFFLSVFIKIKSRPALLNHATPLACALGCVGVCGGKIIYNHLLVSQVVHAKLSVNRTLDPSFTGVLNFACISRGSAQSSGYQSPLETLP